MICPDTHNNKSFSHWLRHNIKEWDESIDSKIQRIINEIEEVYQNEIN
jgi:hypothetical protein|tara:strand:+ start:1824 stop:1967 length:144 start_codon:yes stop_codon:yes gene_type:complete